MIPTKLLAEYKMISFFHDKVKLPEGSIVVKYNENIPSGKLKILNATENGQELKGIKLLETSDKNLGAVANMRTPLSFLFFHKTTY